MKILVPVAFEETSFSAFAYASQLVKDIGGELTLFNVINLSYDSINPLGSEYVDAVVKGVESRMEYFKTDYPKDRNIDIGDTVINTEVQFGVPSSSIINYAQDEDFDMIIMGTRDKTGLFDQLLGSTSANVVTSAPCPVMLIHSNTDYFPIKKTAFAFDSKGNIDKILRDYSSFNATFKAKTDFIHIAKEDDETIKIAKNELNFNLEDNLGVDYAYEIKNIRSESIKDTIIDYCKISDIDLLAMVHRERSFLSSLLKPSLSARVAREFKQPVLVYNDKNNEETSE